MAHVLLPCPTQSSFASRMSHSCAPNCQTMVVSANGKLTIAMYALRRIEVGAARVLHVGRSGVGRSGWGALGGAHWGGGCARARTARAARWGYTRVHQRHQRPCCTPCRTLHPPLHPRCNPPHPHRAHAVLTLCTSRPAPHLPAPHAASPPHPHCPHAARIMPRARPSAGWGGADVGLCKVGCARGLLGAAHCVCLLLQGC